MDRRYLFILLSLLFLNGVYSQNGMSRFEELKEWKLSYIKKNTSMNSKELEVYKCIFEDYENTYYNEIWIKVKKMRKELNKPMETIPNETAIKYINEIDAFEIKGMQMKHERNERLLKKIRPKIVLNIINQEKKFDRELFNRIRRNSKKE